MEQLQGSRTIPVTWGELDADYRLKLPTLFHPCLDALTEAITSAIDLFGMGRRGIAPVTHYLEIAAGAEPIALGRPLELRYRIALFRAQLPASRPGAAARDRLLLDQHVALHAFRRCGSDTSLGHDGGGGAPLRAGSFRLIQVLTRPFAEPAQRQVTEVPAEMCALDVRPLPEPPPSLPRLWAAPEGLAEMPCTDALPMGRVWGRGNTDINHHVTVAEYLRLLETAHVTAAHAAGLDVATRRVARMACLFHRPFYAGEQCAVQGRLLHGDDRTCLLGGVYRRLPDGALEPEPSVGARLEGLSEATADGPQ